MLQSVYVCLRHPSRSEDFWFFSRRFSKVDVVAKQDDCSGAPRPRATINFECMQSVLTSQSEQ